MGGVGGDGTTGGNGGVAESFFAPGEPSKVFQTANGGAGGAGGAAIATLNSDTISAPEVVMTLLAQGGGGGLGGADGSGGGTAVLTGNVIYETSAPGATGANGAAGAGEIAFTNNVIDVGIPRLFVGSLDELRLILEVGSIGLAGGRFTPVALNGGAGGNLVFSGNQFVGTGSSTLDLKHGSVGSATIDAAAGTISIGGSAGNAMTGFANFVLDNGDTFVVGAGDETVDFAADPDTLVYTPKSGNVKLEGVTASNILLDFKGFGSALDLAALQANSSSTISNGQASTEIRLPGAGTITLAGITGTLPSADVQFTMPCYLAGTHILTPRGEVRVEDLRTGDLVTTLGGAHRPLRWVGMGRTLVTPRNHERASPVIVRRGALAENVPHRDLYLMAGHALNLDGVLIPVAELVNYRTIVRDETARVVEYYHLETETHDVILAEGAPAETYLEDANSPQFLNAASRPQAAPVPPCAAVLQDHPTVRAVWTRLSERAGRADFARTEDPDLHLLADGARLDPARLGDGVWHFRLNEPVSELLVVSRSAIPAMLGLGQDQRRLGVAVRGVVLRNTAYSVTFEWDSPCLAGGFHAAEPAERHRWTSGAAKLPVELCPCVRAVEVWVAGLLPYPVEAVERTRAAA